MLSTKLPKKPVIVENRTGLDPTRPTARVKDPKRKGATRATKKPSGLTPPDVPGSTSIQGLVTSLGGEGFKTPISLLKVSAIEAETEAI